MWRSESILTLSTANTYKWSHHVCLHAHTPNITEGCMVTAIVVFLKVSLDLKHQLCLLDHPCSSLVHSPSLLLSYNHYYWAHLSNSVRSHLSCFFVGHIHPSTATFILTPYQSSNFHSQDHLLLPLEKESVLLIPVINYYVLEEYFEIRAW